MERGILPSRQALLSRLEMACEFSSSLIAISGQPGVGKSALLEFFIEGYSPDSRKCFIQVKPEAQIEHLKEQILSQLMGRKGVDPYLTLTESFAQLPNDAVLNAIVILDNSQYVDELLFEELVAVIKNRNLPIQLTVIFAQVRDTLRINQLTNRCPLIEIHVEPLDRHESELLLNYYHGGMIDGDRQNVHDFIEQSGGIAAQLLKWQAEGGGANHGTQWLAKLAFWKKNPAKQQPVKQQPASKPATTQGSAKKAAAASKGQGVKGSNSRAVSPKVIVAMVVGSLLLASVAVAFLYLGQSSPAVEQPNADHRALPPGEQIATDNQVNQNDPTAATTAESDKEATLSGLLVQGWQTVNNSANGGNGKAEVKPIAVTGIAATGIAATGTAAAENAATEIDATENDATEIDAKAIEKIQSPVTGDIALEADETATTTATALNPQSQAVTDDIAQQAVQIPEVVTEPLTGQTPSKATNQPQSASLGSEPNTTAATDATTAVTTATTDATTTVDDGLLFQMDNQWFLNQQGKRFVIQLTGVSDTAILDTYLLEHQLRSRAHIYQAVRQGKPWYVVTVGAYASQQAAREGITRLSSALQLTSPWVKSIATIQSEIINANR